MPRKRIGAEPLSNAEKQRRYRESRRAMKKELEALKAQGAAQSAPDTGAIREQVKKELKETWEPEIKAGRMAAAKKQARENEKRKDRNFEHGRIDGLVTAAAYFCGAKIGRADIARALLSHFMIDREKAVAVLESDKRTKSMTLEILDKSGAWKKGKG